MSIEKLPFSCFKALGSGSTFSVLTLQPFYRYGLGKHFKSTICATFVCKRLRIDEGPNAREVDKRRMASVVNEVLALTDARLQKHENIVDLCGLCWECSPVTGDPLPVLFVEKAEHGSLIDLQRRPLILRYYTKQRLCLEIALGLEALHNASIVHGDMKSENVLIFAHPERGYIAKLSHFGSTVEGGDIVESLGEPTIVLTATDTYHPLNVTVVSFPWNAPEYSDRVRNADLRLLDIYSFGLQVWRTMFDSRDPFESLIDPQTSGDRVAGITKMKESPDFEDLACATLQIESEAGSIAKDLDIEVISEVLKSTMIFNPQKRNLSKAIISLGGQASTAQWIHFDDKIVRMPGSDLKEELSAVISSLPA